MIPMELHQRDVRWALGKDSSPEGDGHGTGFLGQQAWPQAERVQGTLEQSSHILSLDVGWCSMDQGVGLNDLCRSLRSQGSLGLCSDTNLLFITQKTY